MLKMKKIKKISSSIIFFLVLFSLISVLIPISKSEKIYNARCWVDLEWSDIESEKPIVPRDEIKKFNITVKFELQTGESYGKGIVDQYLANPNAPNLFVFIDLEIIDSSPWCNAALELSTVATNFTWKGEIKTAVYISINENAPAYGGDGFIKIKATAGKNLGLINKDSNEFILAFTPAYKPLVDASLPSINSKQITPNGKAVFPIELENKGNAATKVLLEVGDIPNGWTATVTDYVILAEEKGSKAVAYLSVLPPNGFGYHDDEININVKMTPVMAENPDAKGNPLYTSFIVQNRGFSSNGIEVILLIIIIIIILIVIYIIIKKRKKSRDELSY